MLQKEYLSKQQILNMMPYIKKFVVNKFDEALKDVKEGTEFHQHMEDFLSTKKYDELITSIGLEKGTPQKIANIVEALVDITDDGEKDFNTLVNNALRSNFISRTYNFQFFSSSEITFSKEDYLDTVVEAIDNVICNKIENEQIEYATHKLNMKTYLSTWSIPDKVKAILATTECGSLDEIEQNILRNVDFEALVLNKA